MVRKLGISDETIFGERNSNLVNLYDVIWWEKRNFS